MKLAILLALHFLITAFLVILVIFQQSKGAEIGASFGGSNTLLGPGGADKIAVRITTFTAIIFMISCVILVNVFWSEGRNRLNSVSGDVLTEQPFGEQ
jgi:preprotein translocase subunit SecG